MTSPHVLTRHSERVLSVELSRREKKNAITTAMYTALSDALDAAAVDEDVHVVLLHGQPDLFTAGNDVADFLTPEAGEARAGHRFLHAIARFPKPLVAAVGGPAIGIGTTMLLHCDLVVAAAGARFQLPFVALGLCPEAGSSLLLPLMAGPRLAAELLLLGGPFDATKAREAGIVNTVLAEEQLLSHAHTLAGQLAAQPRDALVTTKALLRLSSGRTVAQAIDDEYPNFERLLASPEARRAFQRFLQRQ